MTRASDVLLPLQAFQPKGPQPRPSPLLQRRFGQKWILREVVPTLQSSFQ
jgi:hypothetical protein